jgi:hypothetical protein
VGGRVGLPRATQWARLVVEKALRKRRFRSSVSTTQARAAPVRAASQSFPSHCQDRLGPLPTRFVRGCPRYHQRVSIRLLLTDKASTETLVLADALVVRVLAGVQVQRVIVVPGRLADIVTG